MCYERCTICTQRHITPDRQFVLEQLTVSSFCIVATDRLGQSPASVIVSIPDCSAERTPACCLVWLLCQIIDAEVVRLVLHQIVRTIVCIVLAARTTCRCGCWCFLGRRLALVLLASSCFGRPAPRLLWLLCGHARCGPALGGALQWRCRAVTLQTQHDERAGC